MYEAVSDLLLIATRFLNAILTYIHAYRDTRIHTFMGTFVLSAHNLLQTVTSSLQCIHTYIHTCMHTDTHKHFHGNLCANNLLPVATSSLDTTYTCIHAYIHTRIHTFMGTCVLSANNLLPVATSSFDMIYINSSSISRRTANTRISDSCVCVCMYVCMYASMYA